MSLYLIEFRELFDDEYVHVKLAEGSIRRFSLEDVFEGTRTVISVEYRLSMCRTAVLKRIFYSQQDSEARESAIIPQPQLLFCIIEDFNEVNGELVPTWSDNNGSYI